MVRFYCGLSHVSWNGILPQPGKYVCVSPIYGAKKPSTNSVKVPHDSLVMQDSGAFSDGPAYRLSFEQALERQQAHAERFNYASQIEYRASYDVLIDEVWDEYGVRHKKRWSVKDAENAVNTTIDAARFLNYNRNGIDLVLSAQGVDASQYLKCAQAIIPYINPDRDVFGLGGWCIIGKIPKIMMPVFRQTIKSVIPFLGREDIKKAHIWGVLYPFALGELLWMCDQYGIELSTDSVGPNWGPCMSKWGIGDWINRDYKSTQGPIMGIHRKIHVAITRCWLKQFRQSQYYREPPRDSHRSHRKAHNGQMSIFDLIEE